MRTSTVLETVGSRGTPPPELGPRMPGSLKVGGRVIATRGGSLVLLLPGVGCGAEPTDTTGPAIEA